MPNARIFFSYAREDAERALPIARDLRAAGVALFVDQDDIPASDDWDDAIARALEETQGVLVALSPRAVASHNVKSEWSHGLRKKKRIYPVLIEDCEIPFRLHLFQVVDMRPDYAAGLERLLRSLEVAPPSVGGDQAGSTAGPEPSSEPAEAPTIAPSANANGEPETITTRGGYELALIPGGTFTMGSPDGEKGRNDNEGPQHEVTVRDFYFGRYPVTNDKYARFLNANPRTPEPGYWGDEQYNQPGQPVVGVSWQEARAYCEWADLELPTEAQWEYACRGVAHSDGAYCSGGSLASLDKIAWTERNSKARLHAVGEKPPNDFGLHDMHGNVWEWCQDAWSDDYTESQGSHPAPFEPTDAGGLNRVFRGGSFHSHAEFARSASRRRWPPENRIFDLGFHPARRIT